MQRHPTRFRALCTLPMSAPDEVVAELERATDLGVSVIASGMLNPALLRHARASPRPTA